MAARGLVAEAALFGMQRFNCSMPEESAGDEMLAGN